MHRRLSGVAVVVVAVVALIVLPASVASAATLSSAVVLASATDDSSNGTVTWMVRPSDGAGEDGRSWVEHDLDPGQSVGEYLLIRNLSSEQVTFQLTAADGYFTDKGRFNMLTSDRQSVDAGTWITIQDTVEVASGADVIVPFTITVPADATPGDHAAGVAASIRSGTDDDVGVESRVGFRVMTRVTGDLAPRVVAAVDGSYDGAWNPFEAGQMDIGYTVSNTGNTRLSITPLVTVSTLFGLVSFAVPAEEVVEIAPGEERSGVVTLRSIWPLFLYTAEVTATASVVGTDAAHPTVANANANALVLSMPWPQLVTLALAALLIWWLWHDRRRRDAKVAKLVENARKNALAGVAR